MKKLFKTLLSLFLPPKCTFCRRAIDYTNTTFICKDCMSSLPYIKGNTCIRCSAPIGENALPVCVTCRKYNHKFSGSFTPLLYTGKVRQAIIRMKFYNKDSFCHSFAFLISNKLIEQGFPDIDFITYIPLSSQSFKKRGFNQSQLIAEECAKILNLPLLDTLVRIDGTPRQSTLSRRERRQNAKKSFRGKPIALSGTALLIDDIYTTGSTLAHTASLLLKMGCSKVYVACIALNEKK